MDTKSRNPALVLNAFGDPHCRNILVASIDSPISAATLADHLDISPPTVYKRLNQLLELGLLREYQRVGDDGTHFRVFEASLQRVEIEVDNAGYTVEVEHRRDLDDRFEGFWTELIDSSHSTRASHESPASYSKRNQDPSSL